MSEVTEQEYVVSDAAADDTNPLTHEAAADLGDNLLDDEPEDEADVAAEETDTEPECRVIQVAKVVTGESGNPYLVRCIGTNHSDARGRGSGWVSEFRGDASGSTCLVPVEHPDTFRLGGQYILAELVDIHVDTEGHVVDVVPTSTG